MTIYLQYKKIREIQTIYRWLDTLIIMDNPLHQPHQWKVKPKICQYTLKPDDLDSLNCSTGSTLLENDSETNQKSSAADSSWIGCCCWWADVDHLQPRRIQDKGRFCIDVVALEMKLELGDALGQMNSTLANDRYLLGVDSEVKAAALD